MKKNLIVGFWILVLVSCGIQESVSPDNTLSSEPSALLIQKVTNADVLTSFKELLKDLDKKVEFNGNEIFEVSLNHNAPSMIMANGVDFNVNHAENYGVATIVEKGEMTKVLIVRTVRISDSSVQIDYLSKNFELLVSVVIDADLEKMTFERGGLIEARMSCGDETVDCVIDVYTNHGWLSIWATIQTYYIPATGVAFIGACAAGSCL